MALKTEIEEAYKRFYPSAANAPGVGYLVLGHDKEIIRIDPIAQAILQTTEAQCLNESLKLFLPPETTLAKHDILVDGATSVFKKATEAGKDSVISSMGKEADGKTKIRRVPTGKGEFINVQLEIALLPVGNEAFAIAIISKAEEKIELNLTEEKMFVAQSGLHNKVQQGSDTALKILFKWVNFFQYFFGTSRGGRIASLFCTFLFWGLAIYVILIVTKVIPPPDFSTHQTIDLRTPTDADNEALPPAGKPQAAKGYPNKK